MAVDVLVTGGAGALGRQIVATLRGADYEVIACGRDPTNKMVDALWDISRREAPEPDFRPTVVVHAAARVGSYQHPLDQAIPLFDVNVTGTLRVAQWCVSRRVEKMVLISGSIVYGEWAGFPKSEDAPANPWLGGPYAVSKWCSEHVASLVKSAGGELAILRLSSLYGLGYDDGLIQRLIRQGRRTGRIHLKPPFEDAFDLLHVSDAARTVKSAIEAKKPGLWNVGAGALTTIQELGERCAAEVHAQVTSSNEAPSRDARVINWVNDQKARDDLGHINQVSLNLGIAEIAASMP